MTSTSSQPSPSMSYLQDRIPHNSTAKVNTCPKLQGWRPGYTMHTGGCAADDQGAAVWAGKPAIQTGIGAYGKAMKLLAWVLKSCEYGVGGL